MTVMLEAGLAISTGELSAYVATGLLPFARIAGVCMVAPIFGALFVPTPVRIVLAAVLTIATLQFQPVAVPGELGLLLLPAIARELVIGVAMGFVAQMIFDAVVVGGQTVAMSMGLGFATMVDPARGSVPVLSQFYLIIATLLFLALNAHLALLRIVMDSFVLLPAGTGSIGTAGASEVVGFGSTMFASAIKLALPAVVALLIVNLAFGVMSRAAPSMNLFAVGFPVTMLIGFFILTFGVSGSAPALTELFNSALGLVSRLGGG